MTDGCEGIVHTLQSFTLFSRLIVCEGLAAAILSNMHTERKSVSCVQYCCR